MRFYLIFHLCKSVTLYSHGLIFNSCIYRTNIRFQFHQIDGRQTMKGSKCSKNAPTCTEFMKKQLTTSRTKLELQHHTVQLNFPMEEWTTLVSLVTMVTVNPYSCYLLLFVSGELLI